MTVRETNLNNVEGITGRLAVNYHVATSTDIIHIVLIAMHAARQHLARYLREDTACPLAINHWHSNKVEF